MTSDVTSVLEAAGIRYEVLLHARAETAGAEAEALGLPPGGVANTLVVKAPNESVRAVLPASERIDLRELANLLEVRAKRLHLATEEDLAREYPDFELGTVPPFGGASRDRVVIDSRFAEQESLVLAAGSHEQSLRMQTDDLFRLTGAEVAEICQE